MTTVITRRPDGTQRRAEIDADLEAILRAQLSSLLVLASNRLLDRNEASLLKTLLDLRASLPPVPTSEKSSQPSLEALPAEALLLLAAPK